MQTHRTMDDKSIDFHIIPHKALRQMYVFMTEQLVMCCSLLISAIALPDLLAVLLCDREEEWTRGPWGCSAVSLLYSGWHSAVTLYCFSRTDVLLILAAATVSLFKWASEFCIMLDSLGKRTNNSEYYSLLSVSLPFWSWDLWGLSTLNSHWLWQLRAFREY